VTTDAVTFLAALKSALEDDSTVGAYNEAVKIERIDPANPDPGDLPCFSTWGIVISPREQDPEVIGCGAKQDILTVDLVLFRKAWREGNYLTGDSAANAGIYKFAKDVFGVVDENNFSNSIDLVGGREADEPIVIRMVQRDYYVTAVITLDVNLPSYVSE